MSKLARGRKYSDICTHFHNAARLQNAGGDLALTA